MADCLADRMVLTKIVLAVGWMCVKEATKGADLMAVNWVQYMVSWLTDCGVGTIVVL